MTLAPRHREWFEKAGIDPADAERYGCFTAETIEDLPGDYRSGLGRALPGVVLPWKAPDGFVSPQLRPDVPGVDEIGEPLPKYRFQKGSRPVLWALQPSGSKVLIVEGSKQCLVAARHAPSDYAVYGIAGIWAWSTDQLPIPDLSVVDGKEVVLCPDADAAGNRMVYDGCIALQKALKGEGAKKVTFAQLPARGTKGLDDLLATRPLERRSDYLKNLIEGAEPKPADKVPTKNKKPVVEDPNRPYLDVDDDRLLVVKRITSYLTKRWDGNELFSHGGVLSEYDDGEIPTMKPLTLPSFQVRIQRACTPIHKLPDGTAQFTWPDPNSTSVALSAMTDEYTPLSQLALTPFIRKDGSVVQTEGYDPVTQTLLVLRQLKDIDVPDIPTGDQVAAARELLLTEWLGDLPFSEDGSAANALGLVLTPFIRGHVPLVPMAVIDGLQMSVGKNLFADCFSIVVQGRPADPMPFTSDDNENRKALLPIFASGQPLAFFDEAHEIHGTNLARAITTTIYRDRVLGISKVPEYPNKMTMVAMGNQVNVVGDLARRVYRIGLTPHMANPQDRSADLYRHPDLRGWTLDHRGELISACLTMIRNWYAQGCPLGPRDMGSFEMWQGQMGGILGCAGVGGFLENRKQWRAESDYQAAYWEEHAGWLHLRYGEEPFTAAQVRADAVLAGKDYSPPPGEKLAKASADGYARELGQAWSRKKDQWIGNRYRLRRGTTIHDSLRQWHLEYREPGSGEAGGTGVTPTPPSPERTHLPTEQVSSDREDRGVTPVAPGPSDVVVFDLETASADELYSRDDFIRLGGWTTDGENVSFAADPAEFESMLQTLGRSDRIIGHNIMGFDLQALHRTYRLDIRKLALDERVYDTLLAARYYDPPMAKERKYDFERAANLNALGERFELGAKSADLADMAKEHGGFDKIPLDDPTYREYLANDVTLNWRVYEHLRTLIPDETYLKREHKVAALAAQFSLNGFKVDKVLLAERFFEGQQRRQAALKILHEKYGLPIHKLNGQIYDSPLATTAGKAHLIKILEERGVTSFWVTGKTEAIATSREAMSELGKQHMDKLEVVEICKLVIAVVTTRTVYGTIQDCMIGDRVHTSISMNQSTGRWSSRKPGLTVMGKRGGKWREREVLVADPGEVIIACDLSQIDMRAVAALSQDPEYINMLQHEDPHAEIAQMLFGDRSKRDIAKPIGHGWNYGRGIKAISEDNDIAPELVRQFDRESRARFPRLVEWQDEVREIAASGELLDNGFGRRMRPDPSRAHTQGPALMGQGAARDLMMTVLLNLPEECWPMLRAQVHDEVVLSVPAEDAVDVQRAVLQAMDFEWRGVPIKGDGGPVDRTSWGQVYASK